MHKISKKEKEDGKTRYFGVLITDKTREKWKKFAQNNNYSTTSKLVRNAVNFFIDFHQNIEFIKDLSTISNEFKNPLTSIKGFAQLLIENLRLANFNENQTNL